MHGIYGQRNEDKSLKVAFTLSISLARITCTVYFSSYFRLFARQQCATTAVNMLFMSGLVLPCTSRFRAFWPCYQFSLCLSVCVLLFCYLPPCIRLFTTENFSNAMHSTLFIVWSRKKVPHTHTSKYSIVLTEIMKFASKCNAVNTQISKSFREYSIDILFNDCKSKQKCPILYNVGPK